MAKLQKRRREFLKFLAASPLLTVPARLLAEETLAKIELSDYLIDKPEEALDVFDFHTVAKQKLPPAHYGYLTTGTDANETLSANRRAFEDYYLRPMRMVDTTMTGDRMLGRISRHMMWRGPAPSARAASTYSSSRTASVSPRTTRQGMTHSL